MRPTKCRMNQPGCEGTYTKWSLTQKCCSNPLCALELVNRDKEKRAKKQHAADKIRIKTRREWLKDAQTAFNAYIRHRDKGKRCICCDRTLENNAIGGGYDCGHYRSVGSAPHLRFDERNAHGQTKQCNRWGSGRAVDYRLGLINRIGLKEVELLESDQLPKKYTIPELQEIQRVYRSKLKELQ
jgi:hypothetical protein